MFAICKCYCYNINKNRQLFTEDMINFEEILLTCLTVVNVEF